MQLSLVQPFAPYLHHGDLLIAADCVPFAYGAYHRDFQEGRAVLVGCPKLDDLAFYVKKLEVIFKTAKPRSLTVVKMEVPCCTGILQATLSALETSGHVVPVRYVTIGIRGDIVEDQTIQPGEALPLPARSSGCGGGCPSVG